MNDQVMTILKAIIEANNTNELERIGAIVVQQLVNSADNPADMAEYLNQAMDDMLSAMGDVDSTDQYRNLINRAFNEASQNEVGPEVYLELLELVTARVVLALS